MVNVQLVFFLITCLPFTVYSEGSVDYCYTLPACNASMWSTLSPKYCNGTRQSPINIVTADVKADINLTAFNFTGFNDSSHLINIENTGKSVKILSDALNIGVSGGGLQSQYNTTQLHFHWGNGSSINGSEHTVDGQQYAMEMHIVNSRADLNATAALSDSTGYAVLGFFIEATNDTGKPEVWKNLTSLLANITKEAASVDIKNQFTIDSLLQGVDRTKYYRYRGSLTTPTCNENVVWTVFKDTIKVSKNLIDLFSSTVHTNTTTDPFIITNYRPVQALNGRVVTSQPTTTAAPSTIPSSALHHTLSVSTALLCLALFRCFVSVSVCTAVKDLGVIINPSLFFEAHVNNITRITLFYLRNIAKIRNMMSLQDIEKLVFLLLLYLFVVWFLPVATSADSSKAWCYKFPLCDESTWSLIPKAYCNGSRQSPINIVTKCPG
ncbi:hypothetical protein HF521_020313 [Silurus meridionalis]|uniref:Carbonic anhydrase n=1 Tax=Silurus meridionalis TaxID=175797 RepID=A0A8T0BGS9_SILME|nr:hypothetical protein HF521_020313 [Silurus meridionalis]